MRPYNPDTETAANYISRLEAEIERLRAVLLKIEEAAIYAPAHHIAEMARTALNEQHKTT